MTSVHLEVLGLRVRLEAPGPLLDEVVARLGAVPVARCRGVEGPHYSIAARPEGRVDLERDGGGLRRAVEAPHAVEALVDDLIAVLVQRRPGAVVLDGAAVAVEGRGVLVLDDPPGPSDLLPSLVSAGAEPLSGRIVVLDRHGVVAPVAVSGGVGEAPAPAALALVVTAAAEGSAAEEVVGARAVLGVLRAVRMPSPTSPEVRALARGLAAEVVERRWPRAGAVEGFAAEVIDRARDLDLPAAGAGEVDADAPVPGAAAVSPPFAVFDDLLTDEEHAALVDLATGRAEDFAPSGVHAADGSLPGHLHPELRRSGSIYDLGPAGEPLLARFEALLPHLRRELGVPWFPLGRLEHHLTAHGDGDHFTRHVDNTTPDTALRQISAVYYFNRSPRRFTGGELRLFDTVERNGVVEPSGTHTDVEPLDNRLLCFRSDAHHEVRPVRVDSDDPGDRRFTVVLWARRVPPVQAVFRGDPDTVTARQHALVPALTDDGFRVVATPPAIQDRLRHHLDREGDEARPESPDETFLPSGAPSLVPVGDLGDELLSDLQGLHEEWCGLALRPSAAYGIRVYGEGQTLRPHCDRVETHVISSIVHVAADVDEPWPLTVQDARGRVHDVLLEPGQMLLYESAKLPHGRPSPLQGRSYASVFLHYRPVDWEHTLADVCRRAADQGMVGV